MSKISIVIPTHNHCEDLLKPCLEAILKHTSLDDTEVIIVANGCTDNTREYLADKPVKMLWFDEGLGYTKATNEGIKAATGDIIILMNNDAFLLDFQEKNGWIRMLCDPMKDPKVGMTGPLRLWDWSAEHDFLVFCCVAIKRELFDKLGLLDEIYSPGGCEDIEFCIRAEQIGYKVLQVPSNEKCPVKDGYNVNNFPLWHKGEGTMLDDEHKVEWEKIVDRNRKILEGRFKLPEGLFYQEDYKPYRDLVEEVPDGGTICELGVWTGKSLCVISDIAKRKGLKVIAVDTFRGATNEPAQMALAIQNDVEDKFRANTKRFGLDPKILKMTTDEASKLVEDGSLDLCFVDANHSYEGISADLANWIPKVKKGGIIGGHDYGGGWVGVTQAVNERYREVRHVPPSHVWSRKLT